MKTSKFLSLNWQDILKGLVVAILTPIIVIIQQSLEAGVFVFDWKSIGLASLSGGLAYLTKNLFTTSKIVQQNIGLPVPRPPKK